MRLLRLVGLHRRDDDERPLPARVLQHALRAVAPVLVEPQVAIEARRRHAAEVAHHGVDGEVLGLPAGLRDVRRDDHRLRRAGLVDQIDAAAGAPRHRRARAWRAPARASRRRTPARAPARSAAIVMSPVTISVALSGLEPVAVPRRQVVARERARPCARSPSRSAGCRRRAPRRTAAPARRACAAGTGCAFSWPICASRRCFARSTISCGNAGCSTTSAKMSSDGAQVARQRLQPHERQIERAAGRDPRAERVELVGDPEGVARRRPVVEQVERERRGAGLARRSRPRSRHRPPAPR